MKKDTLLSAIILISALAHFAHADSDIKPTPAGAPTQRELVTVITNAEGEHLLADSIGKTLYTFDLDVGKKTSACVGDCAELWPPILVTADEARNIKAPLGIIQRTNKKNQLTYNGHPVYLYAFDRVAADEFGDGIGGVWHYIEIEK